MRELTVREEKCYEHILGLLNGVTYEVQIIAAIDDLITMLLGGTVNACENY